MFSDPNVPNVADYTIFILNQGITTTYLPDNSPYIQWTLTIAQDVVINVDQMPPILYVLAVYNYALARLIAICPDQTGQTFFADLRTKYGILNFIGGVISSSSDEGTSESITVLDSLKDLQIGQLQLLKTPYGQYYLDYAQAYGSTIVDLT